MTGDTISSVRCLGKLTEAHLVTVDVYERKGQMAEFGSSVNASVLHPGADGFESRSGHWLL